MTGFEIAQGIGSVIMWAPSVPILIVAGMIWVGNRITDNGRYSTQA